MAECDHDHQVAGPGRASRLASHYRLDACMAGPIAARAGFRGWMSLGACRNEDPELFFPAAPATPALRQVRSAKAICARCPVQANCLSYALITGQDEGIWGGTTWEERWPSRRPGRRWPAELAGPR